MKEKDIGDKDVQKQVGNVTANGQWFCIEAVENKGNSIPETHFSQPLLERIGFLSPSVGVPMLATTSN